MGEMTSDTKFADYRPYARSSGNALNYHIVFREGELGEIKFLCGANCQVRTYADPRYGIERAVEILRFREEHRRNTTCKHCARAAEKLRSPLDRLADI